MKKITNREINELFKEKESLKTSFRIKCDLIERQACSINDKQALVLKQEAEIKWLKQLIENMTAFIPKQRH